MTITRNNISAVTIDIRKTLIDKIESEGYRLYPEFDFYVHPDRDTVLFLFTDRNGKTTIRYKNVFISSYADREGNSKIGYVKVVHYGRDYMLHILKAMLFLERTGCAEHLPLDAPYGEAIRNGIVVNHKDGNRGNSKLSNLEWATYADNVVHAFKFGLRTDNYFGVAYDVIKEKEFEFYSINELGRQIGLHGDYISRYLKSPRTSLLAHRYMVRHSHESDYPVKLTKDDVWRKSIGGCLPMLVRDTETDKWQVFGAISHVKAVLGVGTNKGMFGALPEMRVIGKYEFHPIHDYETIMNAKRISDNFISCNIDAVRGVRKPVPVGVRLSDGTEMRFNGTQEAAEHFGMSKAALKARLHRYNGKWKDLQFWFIKERQ